MHKFLHKATNFGFFGPNLLCNEFLGSNCKNLTLDLKSTPLRYYVHQFSDKTDKFEFLGLNSPKKGFWSWNFKNLTLDLESAPLRYYVQPFSDKRNKFKLFGLNLLKSGFWDRKFKNLSLHSESTSLRCPPIFRQNGQTWVFEPKFAEKWILGSEFEKSKSKFRISILETLWTHILKTTLNFST